MLAQKGIAMLDERKTKSQLITELRDLRQRLLVTEQEQKKLLLSLTQQKRAEKIMNARLRLSNLPSRIPWKNLHKQPWMNPKPSLPAP
jgi:hypothetical protein